MSARVRTCRACEGTGVVLLRLYDLSLEDQATTKATEAWFGTSPAVNDYRCGACLGTGQVSERIPASDAIADAETLRPLLARGIECHPLHSDSYARWGIEAAARRVTSLRYAQDRAWAAARAAFRAVPGLRG